MYRSTGREDRGSICNVFCFFAASASTGGRHSLVATAACVLDLINDVGRKEDCSDWYVSVIGFVDDVRGRVGVR